MKPAGNIVVPAVVVVWLSAVALLTVAILGSRERGSDVMMTVAVSTTAVLVGLPSLVYVLVRTLATPGQSKRETAAALGIVITVAWFGGVCLLGRKWYAEDQQAAKAFVEARLAEALAGKAAGAEWPDSQLKFTRGRPLPRLLEGQQFYSGSAGGGFEVNIRVDFDGGWHLSDRHSTWRRST